jgi:uncharacterized radical SAM superfamily protein
VQRIKDILQTNSIKEFEVYLKEIYEIKRNNFGDYIRFYAPSFMHYSTSLFRSSLNDFPTISITGNSCALKCRHCGGKVLNTMYSATTPEELFNLCEKLKNKGAVGCLISGGCLPNGSVPLKKFIKTIEKIKQKLKIIVYIHTGIIDYETAKELQSTGIDGALIDIIGSDLTIKEIYGLNITKKSYEKSLKALNDAQLNFIPHVIVGLYYGKLKGEIEALRMIEKYQPSALVIIAFMPIQDTKMEKVSPPKPLEIGKISAIARLMFPKTSIALGCMRPKGEHRKETDILAIKAGVNAIAFPTEEAIEFAKKQKYEINFSSNCCSQIFSDSIVKS